MVETAVHVGVAYSEVFVDFLVEGGFAVGWWGGESFVLVGCLGGGAEAGMAR